MPQMLERAQSVRATGFNAKAFELGKAAGKK
jgi:hypothetical protein